MLIRTALLAVGLNALASAAVAQRPPDSRPTDAAVPAPLTDPRTGDFEAVLTLRSPESGPTRWAERFRFPGDLTRWDYDLAGETFSLHVPEDYDPGADGFGVVVWVSPADRGGIPEELKPVFDARHLIWIGPNGAGNSRHIFKRSGMALDAATNVAAVYRVDPDRIFVAGLSGGGRIAAMSAVAYPDVFSGGLPIAGVTTFLDVPLESDPGRLVLRFPRPEEPVLERARRQPFVVVTGSGDFNREECRLAAAAYQRDGFTAVRLLDIEGMGHEMPPPEDLGRALDLLSGSPGPDGPAFPDDHRRPQPRPSSTIAPTLERTDTTYGTTTVRAILR